MAHVFHGTCMCLYLVDQWVRDDANLVATIELLTLEKALHVWPLLCLLACVHGLFASLAPRCLLAMQHHLYFA